MNKRTSHIQKKDKEIKTRKHNNSPTRKTRRKEECYQIYQAIGIAIHCNWLCCSGLCA